MPNPHFDVKVISRSAGQSAVASASYRSGDKLHDERADKTFDYTRKDGILHSEIMTPVGAPSWATDRGQLWNEVEAAEKRKDAQLARDVIGALPRELTLDQNIELVRGFIQENFTDRGMIADFSIHESEAGDGGKNPHVHIMLTMRDVGPDGFEGKNRDWNKKELLEGWRDSWESHTNTQLEIAGRDERVSLESYQEQGIERDAQVHEGYKANNLEKKGVETTPGNKNREARQNNAERDFANKEIEEFEPPASDEPPRDLAISALEERQESAVLEYFRESFPRTYAAAAELYNQVEQFFESVYEKTVESVRYIGERAGWVERAQEQGREREIER